MRAGRSRPPPAQSPASSRQPFKRPASTAHPGCRPPAPWAPTCTNGGAPAGCLPESASPCAAPSTTPSTTPLPGRPPPLPRGLLPGLQVRTYRHTQHYSRLQTQQLLVDLLSDPAVRASFPVGLPGGCMRRTHGSLGEKQHPKAGCHHVARGAGARARRPACQHAWRGDGRDAGARAGNAGQVGPHPGPTLLHAPQTTASPLRPGRITSSC